MISFPVSAEDINLDWMNQALVGGGHLGHYKVVKCEARDSDVPGQTAEIVQISVDYDDPACPLPRQFIAKIKSRNQTVVDQVIRVYDLYRREASFYKEFTDAGIDVPHCFACEHDTETQDLVILMGDLTPARSPSWAPNSDETVLALSRLPAFHAKWWNDPKLRDRDWLVQFDDRNFFFAAASAGNMAIPLLSEHFNDEAEHTAEMMRVHLAHLDSIIEYTANRPFTFVHGDYHPKQMFFPTDAGGRFAVIDWQFPFVAQGAWDFVRMMVLGLDIDERRAREDELIADYYQALLDNGVEDYSMQDLENDLKIGILVNQMIMMVALIDTDISLVEKECNALGVDWRDVLILRGEAAARDWGAVDFLKSIAS